MLISREGLVLRTILGFFVFFFFLCWNDINTFIEISHADSQIQALRTPIKLDEIQEAAPEIVIFDSGEGVTENPRRQFFNCENHKTFMPDGLMKNLFQEKPLIISSPQINGDEATVTIETPVFLSTCIDIEKINFNGFHIGDSNNIMIGLQNNTTYNNGSLGYSIGNRYAESPLDGYFKCLCEQQITCDEQGNTKSNIGSLDPNKHKIQSVKTKVTIKNFDPEKPMKVMWANPYNTADKNNPYNYNPPHGGWDGEDGCFKLSNTGDVISEEQLYLKNLAKLCREGTAIRIQNVLDSIEDNHAPVREILKMARDEKRGLEIDNILNEMKRLADEYKDKIKETLDNPAADDPQKWVSEFIGKYNVWLDKYGRLSKQLIEELKRKTNAYRNSNDGGQRQELEAEIVKINQLLEKFSKKAVNTGLENVAKLAASNDYLDIAKDIERYRLESEHYRRVHPKDARKKDKVDYKNKETFDSTEEIVENKMGDIGNFLAEAQRQFEARTGRKVYSEYQANKAVNIRKIDEKMIEKFEKNVQQNIYNGCRATSYAPYEHSRCQAAHINNAMIKAILDNHLRGSHEQLRGHHRRYVKYTQLEAIAKAHAIENSTRSPNGSYLADYADWGGDNFYFPKPSFYEGDPYSHSSSQYHQDPSIYNMAYRPPAPATAVQWQQPGPTQFNLFGP